MPFAGGSDDVHAPPPSNAIALVSAALLGVALIGIVGLAKSLTPALETIVAWLGAPKAVVGTAIALLVLLPEGLAGGPAGGQRQPVADQFEPGARLRLGEHRPDHSDGGRGVDLAGPAAGARPWRHMVLLALTLLVGVITLGTGRTTVLQGIVHLVIFATFLFLTVVP